MVEKSLLKSKKFVAFIFAELQNAEDDKRVRLEAFVQTAFNINKVAVVAAI